MDEEHANNSRRSSVCIVIPCFNEASRLRAIEFTEFIRRQERIRFLFVNDGSEDNTLTILRELCSQDETRFSYLDLKENRGKAEAVRLGILHVIANFEPEFAGFWDADLATPLDAIPDFLTKFDRQHSLEMVFGTRIRLLGRRVRRKLSRHYLGRCFATTVSIALGLPVYDTQCGAKIFRVTPRLYEIFDEPFVSRWIFDVEIIARVIRMVKGDRARVGEIVFELPLMQWEDVPGSKVRPSDFFRAMREIYTIRKKYL
jgi:dolichyl-phosphate beta-glucosyltransferase